MNSYSHFLTHTTPENDPILQMFLNSKENRDLALNYLNKEAVMEDFKTHFISFYRKSLDAVDELFLENFNKKCEISSPKTKKKVAGNPFH